mmetsp:Transcript_14004/g.29933  ORF Transcript_14004/g.29933 Transcript_14004/m.29933 type:complete len:319 (-) Transcript_14004:2041-2997(-)|eukprot:CAMPEP_0118924726 /NCGR_PEP_ID=MMETSP1169-20130426/2727_1 /TAXON_ID=36882 /ORGANISM="Pyramimonas obovata, Strain CCMP722" /LENGTH=318 /DNA_ID=CAMNT_0006865857 /DNA_START=49 /DNA_END=1005 /DNA_ORIENTATION=-
MGKKRRNEAVDSNPLKVKKSSGTEAIAKGPSKNKASAPPKATAAKKALPALKTITEQPKVNSQNKAAPANVGSNWAQLKQAIGAGKPKPNKGGQNNAKNKPGKAAAVPMGGLATQGDDCGLTKIVALDCEMVGVGPNGRDSKLARVSIVNAQGNVIYDTHVAVKEKVTDFRTHVSGIHWYDIKDAPPFDEVQRKVAAILKGRILVGHTLKSDFSVLMLEHPKKDTRDLALYAPFCRNGKAPDQKDLGKPMEEWGGRGRPKGLKVLAAEVLGLEIQGGEHSSVEDARVALYIYQRVRKKWERELLGTDRVGKGKQQRRN